MKDLVQENDFETKIKLVDDCKILRNKVNPILYNKKEVKHYKLVFTKRRIIEDSNTRPYGY
jgi:hypothetical protein